MKEKKVGIYSVTCTVNGKRYIGQSTNLERRKIEHKSHSSNRYLRNDIEKYGFGAFVFEVLEECAAKDLSAKEVEYIATLKPEYNILSDGHTLPPEICQQISNSVREVWNAKSDEEKKFIVENQLTWSFEIGHEVPEYVREKLRKAAAGKTQSAETVAKRSKKLKTIMRGNRNGNKKVYCEETATVYESIKKAATAMGISPTGISSVLNGRQETAGGYHWQYADGRPKKYFKSKETSKAVRCVETGEIFPSIHRAAEFCGLSDCTVSCVVNEKNRTAGGYHWQYADENPRVKYAENTKASKAVRCVETGEIFPSMIRAAEFCGVSVQGIICAVNGKQKTSAGYHWELIKEEFK